MLASVCKREPSRLKQQVPFILSLSSRQFLHHSNPNESTPELPHVSIFALASLLISGPSRVKIPSTKPNFKISKPCPKQKVVQGRRVPALERRKGLRIFFRIVVKQEAQA
eukprot:TRINITY_DN2699_c0_g1_i6.p1 TRINITY_DN2699_c0_g1~~TRINITY_DN2699_c0_g1_i6.p1  ORF type:complete len:110 (-),score=14.90 TRINITY_DN2699_c0_g1_i6:38-367(-)